MNNQRRMAALLAVTAMGVMADSGAGFSGGLRLPSPPPPKQPDPERQAAAEAKRARKAAKRLKAATT